MLATTLDIDDYYDSVIGRQHKTLRMQLKKDYLTSYLTGLLQINHGLRVYSNYCSRLLDRLCHVSYIVSRISRASAA